MFKLKVLCTGFMLSSTVALLGVSFGGAQDSFEKMMEHAAKHGASESAQRTVDAWVRVAFSEKSKQRGERFNEELTQLFVKHMSELMDDVMNEITPEDAQELLLATDSMFKAMKQAIEFFPNAEKMSDEERFVAGTMFDLSLKAALFQLVKYLPALEKHKDAVQEKQQGAVGEVVQLTDEVLNNSYLQIRAIIEHKARS